MKVCAIRSNILLLLTISLLSKRFIILAASLKEWHKSPKTQNSAKVQKNMSKTKVKGTKHECSLKFPTWIEKVTALSIFIQLFLGHLLSDNCFMSSVDNSILIDNHQLNCNTQYNTVDIQISINVIICLLSFGEMNQQSSTPKKRMWAREINIYNNPRQNISWSR